VVDSKINKIQKNLFLSPENNLKSLLNDSECDNEGEESSYFDYELNDDTSLSMNFGKLFKSLNEKCNN
jgi:hypothetical protein